MIPAQAVEAARDAVGAIFGEPANSRDMAHVMAILEAAAPHIRAQALEEAAEEFHARLPDGTGNGRAYNSHQVARILRERAHGND